MSPRNETGLILATYAAYGVRTVFTCEECARLDDLIGILRRSEASVPAANIAWARVTPACRFMANPNTAFQFCCLIDQIIKFDHGAGALHAARVADNLLVRRAVGVTLDVCLRLPFGIGDELAPFTRA